MAMTGTNIPAGWHYDAFTDSYKSTGGDVITRQELNAHHGSIDQVLVHRAYDAARQYMAANVTSARMNPTNPFAASISNAAHNPQQGSITWGNSTGAGGAIGQGQFAVASASSIQPTAMLSFETDFGRVSLNIKTGELTLPVGMSRENSIREFWLGFQKYFKSADETSYQSQIAAMKKKVEDTERKAEEYGKYAVKETAKNIADKIRTKYNGQKLIMVKPEDLAKFIEDV